MCARVSATASLGIKKSLEHKKGYGKYDNAAPHHSITIEREFDEGHPNEFYVTKAEELHGLARKLVEKKINEDMRDLEKVD